MDVAISKNKVPIRLTDERWYHISTGHPEVANYYFEILETIENPKIIYRGNYDGLIAISQKIEQTDKFIAVVYKEINSEDGFVITAYISNKEKKIKNREVIWKL
jgi:hypothetical protein